MVAALAAFWVSILRLVAAQRRALSTKVEALEAANRELEAFAGRVAHDMRNVLSPVQLAVDALGAASTEAAVHAIAQRVARSCARGRDLVEGLLAFSRAGGKETSPQHADAIKEVAGAIELLSDSLRETETHVERNLPDSAPVAIAPALLHVVFVNVIGNAVKFMAGGPERLLMIDATRTLVGWRFRFTDTGPGISEHEIPRVFDALYRGARSAGGGIGLGLATVKRIVESRGGTVSIASTQGRGTTVTLELPEFSAAPAVATRGRSSTGGEARESGGESGRAPAERG